MKTIGIVERSVVGVDKLMYFLDDQSRSDHAHLATSVPSR